MIFLDRLFVKPNYCNGGMRKVSIATVEVILRQLLEYADRAAHSKSFVYSRSSAV